MILDLLKQRDFWLGISQVLPLCLAVLPWGLLVGSMAVSSGLTPAQGIGMSAFIFAGAAQLVTISMLAAGSGTLAICLTIFIITSQHLLYALILRDKIAKMPITQRLPIGFLLTDELFALAVGKNKYSLAYLIGAGFTFYLAWLLFTITGVILASNIPDIAQYHLDFSIVATFVAIVVPMIRKASTLVGAASSLLLSLLFTSWQLAGAVVLAGIIGMALALLTAKVTGEAA